MKAKRGFIRLLTMFAMLFSVITILNPVYANEEDTHFQADDSKQIYNFDNGTHEVTGIYQGTSVENFKHNVINYNTLVYKNGDEVLSGDIQEGMNVVLMSYDGNTIGEYIVGKLKELIDGNTRIPRATENTPDYFYRITNGKSFDFDNNGAQCVDLFTYFNQVYNKGIKINTGNGYASGIFLYRNSNNVLQYFDEVPVSQMKDGDWAIWGFGSPEAPNSHIAMFRLNESSGRAIFLNQNYKGQPYVSQNSLSKVGIIGVLRPKVYSSGQPAVHYANLDSASINSNTFTVSGWHITSKRQPDSPYHNISTSRYLFAMDAYTGLEIGRFKISQVYRPDVQNAYSGVIKNAGYGGFLATFETPQSWYGKTIYFMVRYADDQGGDLSIDDYFFDGWKVKVPTVKDKIPYILYQGQVQSIGWMNYVGDSLTTGTVGAALRLEALKINLVNPLLNGSISYQGHVSYVGWQSPVGNNQIAGTVGKELSLEAIRISLNGDLANQYDIYYRTQVQNFGWLGWTKNGASAGTVGFGYRMEAIQIKLVKKTTNPIPIDSNAFITSK